MIGGFSLLPFTLVLPMYTLCYLGTFSLPRCILSSQVPAFQDGVERTVGSLWRSSRTPELRYFLRTGHCHMGLGPSSQHIENSFGQGSPGSPLP